MNTPIFDFVSQYVKRGTSRFHMPGHKGHPYLGCEERDITEIDGADVLYAPDGIIAESERNATALFKTGHTFYSAEGSSLSIKAMLALALAVSIRLPRPAEEEKKQFCELCNRLCEHIERLALDLPEDRRMPPPPPGPEFPHPGPGPDGPRPFPPRGPRFRC